MRTWRRKNSKPQANVEFRELYRSRNPSCEIGDRLVFAGELEKYTLWCVEAHHIFGGKGRWDLMGNLICLSRESHAWCHKFPSVGRIVCLYVKLRKGELILDDVHTASGQYLEGWLENHQPLTEPYIGMWRELIQYAESQP